MITLRNVLGLGWEREIKSKPISIMGIGLRLMIVGTRRRLAVILFCFFVKIRWEMEGIGIITLIGVGKWDKKIFFGRKWK